MKRLVTELLSLTVVVGLAVNPGLAQKERRSVNADPFRAGVRGSEQSSSRTMMEIPTTRQRSTSGLSYGLNPKFGISRPAFRVAGEGGELPEIYGSVTYSDDVYRSIGLYNLPLASGEEFELVVKRAKANYGGVYKDGIYYATTYGNNFSSSITQVVGYDIKTGEEVYNYTSETTVGPLVAMGLALDPLTENIYGIVYNEEVSGLMLATIVYNKTPEVTKIADLEGAWNTFMIDADGTFYGIRKEYQYINDGTYLVGSTLCKIDRENGAVTEIGPTGKYPVYVSGGCIDLSTGRMFWAVSDNESGFICEVDKATGEATTIYSFPDGEEVCGMYVPRADAADKAPGEISGLKADFAEGSLSGTITCVAPKTLFDGTSASGKMTLHVMANGKEIASQEAGAGEIASIPVTVPTPGYYNFFVYASNSVGNGPKSRIADFYVGKDTPVATTATLKLEGNKMMLSWLPVTESVNNGYLNPEDVTYNVVRYPDSVQVAKGIKETTFEETLDTPDKQTAYFYGVTAEYEGLASAEAISNAVSLGVIVPPYTGDFESESGFAGYTIINANNDEYTWTLDTYYGFAKIRWNSTLAMDDWLITPGVSLKAGESYEISFPAYSSSLSNTERLEVKWGAAPTVEGMTNTAVEPMDIKNSLTGPEIIVSAYVTPEEDGIYYFGVHGISPKDKSSLWVGSISISEPMSASLPGLATDLSITPDPDGSLKGILKFKAPDVTMGEKPLRDLTLIEVLNSKDEVVYTFENPTPGEELSCEVTETKSGTYTYSVVCSNSYGKSVAATVSSHIGLDKPSVPANLTMTSALNSGEVTLVWDAVDTDCNGNKINTSLVTYTVFRIVSGEQVEIASDLKSTSYAFEAVEAGKQEMVQCAVFAKTEAGYGSGALSQMLPVGTPYPGLIESFANGRLSYIWGVNTEARGSWSIYTDRESLASQDNDNGFLGMEATQAGDGAYIFSGLVSLDGMENAGMTFYTFNFMGEGGTPDENIIRVSIREFGGEYVEALAGTVQDLCNAESGWHKVTIDLDAYKGKTIQVKIEAEATNFAYVLIDNIRIAPLIAQDLKALDISAPSVVAAGNSFKVSVTVQNNGTETVKGYSVELFENGVLVATKEAPEILPEARVLVDFERTMSPVAKEPLSYYAQIILDADGNPDDNRTAVVTVAPRLSTLPGIDDLAATVATGKVTLTWSEPSSDAQKGKPVTDDFEDADSFASEYGNWVFVDVDGSPVGGFEQTGIPGVNPGQTTGSFWIWDQTVSGNETFAGHSGTKYLFALYRADQGQADDWAISPVLDGMEQTISFYARSYDGDYPEKIEVYYSTGSTDVKDFVKISGVGGEVGEEWTLYEAKLPKGAKRFAIRSCAKDAFMLMVDDVTYIPEVKADYEIMGYNVYRDGVKLNSELIEENEYEDINLKDETTYSYVVTVVYKEGESAGSNEVTVFYSESGVDDVTGDGLTIRAGEGVIEISAPEAASIMIATTDGRLVYNNSGVSDVTLNITPGVYVVKVAEKTLTVMVR